MMRSCSFRALPNWVDARWAPRLADKWRQRSAKRRAQLDDAGRTVAEAPGALCQQHGVVLNLHNHTYEVADDLHDLKGTLSRIPDVKLGPDLNWLVRAGVDPAWFIRHFGRQIVFMHLRDQKKDGRWSEGLGEGDTDFAAIGQALHDIAFARRRGHRVGARERLSTDSAAA